uniref:Granzyme M n=1 Tax=Prolemur simus TaxID=1328070 RepID=A0A8C9AGE9_PROSS
MEARQCTLLALALGALCAVGSTFGAQIIGGKEAAPHSRPYMASLQKDGSHRFTLPLHHPRSPENLSHGSHFHQGVGSAGFTLAFRIRAAVQHPNYRPAPALKNDLLLLQLEGKVKPSKTIQPLHLPRSRQVVAAGAWCSVAGWGVTHQGGQLARALQELDVQVLDSRMCNNSRFWQGTLTPYMVCLAADKNKAPCKGDSGGPLVCGKGWLAGILSFSSKVCTDVFKPTVATTVAPYVSWIKKVIRRWQSPPPAQ